jgi:hypothetical protein
MISRHFRDKDEEYLDFELTTTSVGQSINFRFGINTLIMSAASKHRIDWGDGSAMEPIDSSGLNHTYGATGTYPARLWTREKYKNINYILSGSVVLSELDLSQWEYLYNMFLSSNDVGTFSLPSQYNGPNSLTLTAIGVSGQLSDSDGILDLTPWSSYSTIFLFSGTITQTMKRIVVNPINNSSLSGGFRCYSTALEAIGPSASNLSNRTVDLTGLNMSGDLVLQAGDAAPNAFNEIILPSSAFNTNGIDQLQILGASISSIDLSQIRWEDADNTKNISIYQTPVLASIIHPPYGITGSFTTIRFDGSPLTTMDLSSYELGVNSTLRVNSTQITSLTFATSSTTTLTLLQGDNISLSSAPNFTDIPNATEVNGSDIDLRIASLDATNVNKILVDLDTNSTSGFTGRFIDLSGNTAPDGTSGGFDGITAKANLITKGFTVTTA